MVQAWNSTVWRLAGPLRANQQLVVTLCRGRQERGASLLSLSCRPPTSIPHAETLARHASKGKWAFRGPFLQVHAVLVQAGGFSRGLHALFAILFPCFPIPSSHFHYRSRNLMMPLLGLMFACPQKELMVSVWTLTVLTMRVKIHRLCCLWTLMPAALPSYSHYV